MTEGNEREMLICNELTKLSETYKSVKHIFLLVEYYNGNRGIVVSSINELRSAFDHVMRAMTKMDKSELEDEISSAEKHLFRAAYDACEVIILDRLDYIERLKSKVSIKAINKVYPEYATEVLPFAAKLKKDVVGVRQIDNLRERVNQYEEQINKIIDYSENLEVLMPAIVKEKDKEDVESLFSPTFVTIIVGSVLVVISILSYLFPQIPSVWQFLVGVMVVGGTVFYHLKKRKRGDHV